MYFEIDHEYNLITKILKRNGKQKNPKNLSSLDLFSKIFNRKKIILEWTRCFGNRERFVNDFDSLSKEDFDMVKSIIQSSGGPSHHVNDSTLMMKYILNAYSNGSKRAFEIINKYPHKLLEDETGSREHMIKLPSSLLEKIKCEILKLKPITERDEENGIETKVNWDWFNVLKYKTSCTQEQLNEIAIRLTGRDYHEERGVDLIRSFPADHELLKRIQRHASIIEARHLTNKRTNFSDINKAMFSRLPINEYKQFEQVLLSCSAKLQLRLIWSEHCTGNVLNTILRILCRANDVSKYIDFIGAKITPDTFKYFKDWNYVKIVGELAGLCKSRPYRYPTVTLPSVEEFEQRALSFMLVPERKNLVEDYITNVRSYHEIQKIAYSKD